MKDIFQQLSYHMAHINAVDGDPHLIAAMEQMERVLIDFDRRLRVMEETAQLETLSKRTDQVFANLLK